ncbi:MAG TPA: hypothetical protein VND66_03690 [Acidobacteriaceae bacterium]|nr:hypothetical protein [Acidobacteriaceae bacterium]
MRTHKQLVTHQSILQVLPESGCPFCRFLKEFQTARLQNHPKQEISHLCNFHTWGLAAVQDAPAAAHVFLKLLEETPSFSNGSSGCDICREILAEEALRIREFVSCLAREEVSHWLRTKAVLCLPHGLKLRRQVSGVLISQIDTIIGSYRRQLAEELLQLSKEPEADRTGWGSLGRTAEFLVAQRGLRG